MPVHLRDFSLPTYSPDCIRYALARKDDVNRNQYMLVYAIPYGMAGPDRRIITLNNSATAHETPALSASGQPCIWFDYDLHRDPNAVPIDGMLNAFLHAEPPIMRLTGRTREVVTDRGGAQTVHEVEILLKEDDLARVCCFCGVPEFIEPNHRYKRYGGDPTQPQYICPTCESQSKITRNLRWTLRRYVFGGL